jgi:hypothetical protein
MVACLSADGTAEAGTAKHVKPCPGTSLDRIAPADPNMTVSIRSGTTRRVSELARPTQSRYDSPGANLRTHLEGTRMTSRFANAQSAQATRWAARLAVVATAGLAAVIAAPDPAGAASAHAERAIEAVAQRAAGAPIMAIVSLRSQQITIYDADGWILRAPVSSGQK